MSSHPLTLSTGFHPRGPLPRTSIGQGIARKVIHSSTHLGLIGHPLAHFWRLAENTSGQKALESFYGIGPSVSQRIMARYHIHPTMKVGSLADKQVQEITAQLSNMTIENELRRTIRDNIRRLRDMGSYRGRRHDLGLPVRGQRTRTQVGSPDFSARLLTSSAR